MSLIINKEAILSFWKSIQKTLGLYLDVAKIDIADKTAQILTLLICALVGLLLGFMVVIFLSIGCAFLLAKVIGYGWAFLVVGLFWMLLLGGIIMLRRRMLLYPLLKTLYPFDKPNAETSVQDVTVKEQE